jgi:hypothetical protein
VDRKTWGLVKRLLCVSFAIILGTWPQSQAPCGVDSDAYPLRLVCHLVFGGAATPTAKPFEIAPSKQRGHLKSLQTGFKPVSNGPF